MALQFGSGEFGTFDYPQAEQRPESLPQNTTVSIHSKKALADSKSAIWGTFNPIKVSPTNDGWSFTPQPNCCERLTSFISGERFEETPDGVYELRAGERRNRLTNATVRITAIREIYIDDTSKETYLVCAVSCREAWGNEEKLLEISSRDYKSLFKKIREEFRDVQLSAQSTDAIDEYLTKINQRDAKNFGIGLPHEIRSLYIGWLTINGQPHYHIGQGEFYQGYNFPNISDCRRLEIFNTGFGFREVGHNNNVIETLFLFAHSAYTNYFLEKSGCPLRTLLFLKGYTNTLKTSTAATLANIFSTSSLDCGIRLSSTPASLREYIVSLRDNLVLVDDFSNSTGSDNFAMERNAEMIIRAVGDGKFHSSMALLENKKINTCLVRAAVVLTGEEILNLSQSSLFRIITLDVEQGTFDGSVLRLYADKKFLREYFAIFIRFLAEANSQIINYCKENFQRYAAYYRKHLSVPRFIDFAAIMTLEADIICDFAQWCGHSTQFIATYREHVIRAFLMVLTEHQEKSQQQDGVKRFLRALFQILNTDKSTQIADDEKIFSDAPGLYIGFHEKSTRTLWLLFDKAYDSVHAYYRNLNEPWLVKSSTIKEELLKRKISIGKLKSEGAEKNEFVKKAKRAMIGNSRPRMLVLQLDAVEHFLNEN